MKSHHLSISSESDFNNATTPALCPDIEGAPSVVVADVLFNLNSHLDKAHFRVEYKSEPHVVPFSPIPANSSRVEKFLSTPRIKMATCAVSVASVDSSMAME